MKEIVNKYGWEVDVAKPAIEHTQEEEIFEMKPVINALKEVLSP